MTFWQEFALVFTGMGVIPAICLIIGIGLVITEMFIPGFGVCGISGTILIIAGIAIRVAYAGEGNPVIQFFVLLFLVLAALGIGFMIMLRSVKKGLLSRTPIVENETAVPTGITAGTEYYSALVGKVGITITTLRPMGMVSIEGKTYDATALYEFIRKDELIKVDSVEGGKIVVRRKETEPSKETDKTDEHSSISEK